jgi:hypothetical protein
MDLDVTALTDCETLLDLDTMALPAALDAAFPAFGGKATHFGGLARIGDEVISPDAFAIPVFYYHQHLEENGLWPVIDEMLADPTFAVDPAYRAERLDALQSLIVEAPINADFEAAVIAKIRADYGGGRIKFRSSTTAEDLGDFTGAGLYESKAADPDDPAGNVGDDEVVDVQVIALKWDTEGDNVQSHASKVSTFSPSELFLFLLLTFPEPHPHPPALQTEPLVHSFYSALPACLHNLEPELLQVLVQDESQILGLINDDGTVNQQRVHMLRQHLYAARQAAVMPYALGALGAVPPTIAFTRGLGCAAHCVGTAVSSSEEKSLSSPPDFAS